MNSQGGRPRTLTYKKQQELLDHVAHGGSVEEAAEIVGVSLRTVQREAKCNEFFDHDLQLAQHTAPAEPEKLMQRAARTHWRAAAWLLERSDPDRFGKRPPNSCSPENVYDIASWLIETALEATPPEQREFVYRRMQTVADKALDLLMPHPQKIRILTRALATRPTPLSSHEFAKTPGVCEVRDDPDRPLMSPQRRPKLSPQEICTTRPGDGVVSDGDFARRLTLLKREAPDEHREISTEYRDYATPSWQLKQAAPSDEEAAAGATWDAGYADLTPLWFNGVPVPDDSPLAQEVLSPKRSAATKPAATKPKSKKSNAATDPPQSSAEATRAAWQAVFDSVEQERAKREEGRSEQVA